MKEKTLICTKGAKENTLEFLKMHGGHWGNLIACLGFIQHIGLCWQKLNYLIGEVI